MVWAYDNLSRPTRLQQQDVSGGNAVADKRIDFAYDASEAYTQISRYADQGPSEHVVSTHYTYDGIGRLTKLLHTEGPTAPGSGWGSDALAGYEYAYDAASRFTSINSFADGSTSYTHDNTNQLTGADHTGQTDETYTYDANGNRTMSGYDTDPNNQLASDGTYNYTYDDEGNRLTKTKISTGEKEEYTWDHRNRLTKITFKNSRGTVTKTVDQAYDVFNQWVRRTIDPDGATGSAGLLDTYFSHEDGQVVYQYDDTATTDKAHRYLWNPIAVDQLLADEQVTLPSSSGPVLWTLGDHLGTLRDLATYNTSTDDTAIANHRRYDSYGKLISETNAAVDEVFGFSGRALDDSTGLQNNLNRWYDSGVGQWLSEDPIGFFGDGSNLYRYVANSPIHTTDPTGLKPKPGPTPTGESDGKQQTPPWTPPPIHIPPVYGDDDDNDVYIYDMNDTLADAFKNSGSGHVIGVCSWQDAIDKLTAHANRHGRITMLIIADHGWNTGGQTLGSEGLTPEVLKYLRELIGHRLLDREVGATIKLMGCKTCGGSERDSVCQSYANATGATIMANDGDIYFDKQWGKGFGKSHWLWYLYPYSTWSDGTWHRFYPESSRPDIALPVNDPRVRNLMQ